MTEVKITGLDNVLDMLKSLPPEVVGKRGGPVKLALKKGAVLLQKAVKANLAQVTRGDESTGLLQKSVIASRGKAPIGGKGERYLVRVKRNTYERKGKAVTTLKTAQLLEYGSSEQKAEPWLRPAFLANAEAAINTVRDELVKRVDKLVSQQLKR